MLHVCTLAHQMESFLNTWLTYPSGKEPINSVFKGEEKYGKRLGEPSVNHSQSQLVRVVWPGSNNPRLPISFRCNVRVCTSLVATHKAQQWLTNLIPMLVRLKKRKKSLQCCSLFFFKCKNMASSSDKTAAAAASTLASLVAARLAVAPRLLLWFSRVSSSFGVEL